MKIEAMRPGAALEFRETLRALPRWTRVLPYVLALGLLVFLSAPMAAQGSGVSSCDTTVSPPRFKLGECPTGPAELTPAEADLVWIGGCHCYCGFEFSNLTSVICTTTWEHLMPSGNWNVRCSLGPTNSPCHGDTEIPGPPPPPANGPSPPQACSSAGQPVSVTTGEMYFSHTDAVVGELAFTRSYNTARITAARFGTFGAGWNTSFEGRLRVMDARWIEIRLSDGYPFYYRDADGDGIYQLNTPAGTGSTIQTLPGGYARNFRAGGSELYDSNGRLQAVTDAAGVTTTYTRDAQGRLVGVTRRGRALSFAYDDTSTRPARLLGPGGVLLATYGYDASGWFRLSSVDYPDGSGYRYGYDASGRVLWVRDAVGRPLEAHAYDVQGRATTSEIGDGREKLTFSYGTNQTTVTNALGNATAYDWAYAQNLPRVTKITGPCSSCGGGAEVRQWTYDAVGNVSAYKQGTDTSTYTFNSDNDMLTATDPLGRVTTYGYDTQGRVTSVSLPGGGSTTTTYAAAGPLTVTEAVTSTENRTIAITYTTSGQVSTTTDPRNKVTTFAYDTTTGDLLSVTDPLSHATTFGYDTLGRRTNVTDALSHSTTTTYDARGRVTRVTQHDATHSDFAYDKSGRRTSVTDPLGRITRYVYDDYGHLTAVVDPVAQTTAYAYDLMSRLVSLTDAKGQKTTFEYDESGRTKKVIYPGGAFESFTYDNLGRLATKTDRKTVVTTYTYDVLGRLTGKTYSDGTTPPVTYTYDTAGRLQTAANGTDTLTWSYDLAGQPLSEQSSKNASTVAYTYDAAGNRLTLGLDGTLFVSYAYDDASRLTSITRGTNVFGFGYDVVNRRTSMTYPNGVNTAYTYDNLNRLLRLKADKGATAITDFQYVYDAAGNRTKKQQLDYTEDYTYDDLYRLTGVDRSAGGTGLWRYAYDAVGNRITGQTDNAVATSTYNEKNQLLSSMGGGQLRVRGTLDEPGTATVNGQPAQMKAGNVFEATIPATVGANTFTVQATDTSGNARTKNYQVTASGTGATYTYDPNGNLTGKTEDGHSWTYEWNAEDQLRRVLRDGTEVVRFAYDPKGRRVDKIAGVITASYAYDGEDILRQVAGASSARYVHGSGLDEPLASENEAGQFTYEHADGLGSELKQTDAAGAVTAERSYDAFGQLQSGTAPGYAYTGREWDPEARLQYSRARYYDPKLGRFSGEDPIRWFGGVNFYAYAGNSPASMIDPWGLDGRPFVPDRAKGPSAWQRFKDWWNRPSDFLQIGCNFFDVVVVQVAADRFGQTYGGAGGGLGVPSCGCNVTLGTLDKTSSEDDILKFLGGQGGSLGGFAGPGMADIYVPGQGTATAVGGGWPPQAGGSWTGMIPWPTPDPPRTLKNGMKCRRCPR
jgi:RHS repeat-associated protein